MYNPSFFNGQLPEELQGLIDYIHQELSKIQEATSETTVLELRPIHVEPVRKREGMIVYADGTDWNPGSGAGVYYYNGASWVAM